MFHSFDKNYMKFQEEESKKDMNKLTSNNSSLISCTKTLS